MLENCKKGTREMNLQELIEAIDHETENAYLFDIDGAPLVVVGIEKLSNGEILITLDEPE